MIPMLRLNGHACRRDSRLACEKESQPLLVARAEQIVEAGLRPRRRGYWLPRGHQGECQPE
jgi:hypothetical protein